MERYTRNINLKTIYLTFTRRFLFIVLIFIPIGLVSFLSIYFGTSRTFESSSVVQKNAVFQDSHYQTFKSIVTSEDTALEVEKNLSDTNVFHSNSDKITADEIRKGISLSPYDFSPQSISVTISFQSNDKIIIQKVLDEITSLSVNKALEKNETSFAGLITSSVATSPVDISNTKKFYLIAIVTDTLLALGIPFIWEVVSDEVYDKEDVESLGCEGFTLNLTKQEWGK